MPQRDAKNFFLVSSQRAPARKSDWRPPHPPAKHGEEEMVEWGVLPDLWGVSLKIGCDQLAQPKVLK
jgi:hypothetical protein